MRQLMKMKMEAYEGNCGPPSRLRMLGDIGSKALSPTHHIVGMVYELLAMFCTHHATDVKRAKARPKGAALPQPFGSEATLHQEVSEPHASQPHSILVGGAYLHQ